MTRFEALPYGDLAEEEIALINAATKSLNEILRVSREEKVCASCLCSMINTMLTTLHADGGLPHSDEHDTIGETEGTA